MTEKKRRKRIVEVQGLAVIDNFDIMNYVRDALLQGKSKNEVLTFIEHKYNVDKNQLESVYQRGMNYYRERSLSIEDLQMVINMHVQMYEKMYSFFDEVDFKLMKTKVLQAKEKLMGYHRDQNILEFNQKNTIISDAQDKFNFDKLSEEQKKRYLQLYEKAIQKGGIQK